MSIFGHTIDGLANGLIATSPNRKMEGSASTSDVVRSNETLGERLHKIAEEKKSIYENYALITDKIIEKLTEKLEYYASTGAFSVMIDTETVFSYGLDGNDVKLSPEIRKYIFDILQKWGDNNGIQVDFQVNVAKIDSLHSASFTFCW